MAVPQKVHDEFPTAKNRVRTDSGNQSVSSWLVWDHFDLATVKGGFGNQLWDMYDLTFALLDVKDQTKIHCPDTYYGVLSFNIAGNKREHALKAHRGDLQVNLRGSSGNLLDAWKPHPYEIKCGIRGAASRQFFFYKSGQLKRKVYNGVRQVEIALTGSTATECTPTEEYDHSLKWLDTQKYDDSQAGASPNEKRWEVEYVKQGKFWPPYWPKDMRVTLVRAGAPPCPKVYATISFDIHYNYKSVKEGSATILFEDKNGCALESWTIGATPTPAGFYTHPFARSFLYTSKTYASKDKNYSAVSSDFDADIFDFVENVRVFLHPLYYA